jgi:hypothetical protein
MERLRLGLKNTGSGRSIKEGKYAVESGIEEIGNWVIW